VSVLEFNAPGQLHAADAGFERATGQSAAKLAGRGWLSAVAPEDHAPLHVAWQTAAARRTPLDVRIRMRSHDRGVRRHRMRAEPFGDGKGWLAAMRDIEDLCEAEEARDRALATERRGHTAAMQIKEDLLSTVSHELRTPLNAIVGWAEVLRARDGGTTAGQAAEAIARNAKALARLVDDMLDAAATLRGEMHLRPERLDLRCVVDAAVAEMSPLCEARGLRVEVALGSDPVEITGDQPRLRQVVLSLVSNAVKSTPHGGRVAVTLSRSDSQVALTVADSGEGIAPALLPHVFDAFRQGRASGQTKGLGLGLAMAHQVVELHGGVIGAASPGKNLGATFTVTLPASPLDAGAAPPT